MHGHIRIFKDAVVITVITRFRTVHRLRAHSETGRDEEDWLPAAPSANTQ